MLDSFSLPPRLQALLDGLPLAELAFAPVPVRARYDGWTPARQTAFIHRLALCGSPGASARAVGKSRESAYRLRARPGASAFAAAWDKALDWGRSRAVDLGMERAIIGEAVPVMYRGRRVGTRTRFDDRLLIAVLNAMGIRAPDLWPAATTANAFDAAMAALEAEHAVAENKALSRLI